MASYVQLGPRLTSRFSVPRRRRRVREKRPLAMLGLIAAVVVSGLWFGWRLDAGQARAAPEVLYLSAP